MKTLKLAVVLLMLVGGLSSCGKDEKVSYSYSDSIVGKWRWIETWLAIPPSETNPATPKNTGIEEQLVFNADYTWYQSKNSILIASGSYTLGSGSYTYPVGEPTLTYDSIGYYRNNEHVRNDYYELHNDTLEFCTCFAGATGGATKRWVKVK